MVDIFNTSIKFCYRSIIDTDYSLEVKIREQKQSSSHINLFIAVGSQDIQDQAEACKEAETEQADSSVGENANGKHNQVRTNQVYSAIFTNIKD